MFKKSLFALVLLLSFSCFAGDNNIVINVSNGDNSPSVSEVSRKEGRYDYVYYNPPRQSLQAWGRYVMANGTVRYTHSPSKLKRQAHAARIDAQNYQMMY
ncbi:hypothetical protein IJ670_06560 [bacterium]|nr:hypothetical protein [bacterium]